MCKFERGPQPRPIEAAVVAGKISDRLPPLAAPIGGPVDRAMMLIAATVTSIEVDPSSDPIFANNNTFCIYFLFTAGGKERELDSRRDRRLRPQEPPSYPSLLGSVGLRFRQSNPTFPHFERRLFFSFFASSLSLHCLARRRSGYPLSTRLPS